ncbi:hypothetical protein ATO8_07916 [Roseivivax marinus]|uniref:DUF4174 domain-containing protein n=1 Tax=Roseivivax marinus TaxID=1379903 RepID=W4HLY0_9RHOB|nr:DUF4174 domain-containing protein [Roseivivax marinus]ETW13121.1 hypothetical protein ATO8_07916 [Roseivivax marinus]UMA63375.1 DUF4174 domain-containing protein [Roseivivax marinus]SEL57465.1 protein of unknown function [Roseivivax marinus]
MKCLATVLFAAVFAATGTLAADGAQSDDLIQPAEGRTLEEFHWIKRPLVVFADNPADPSYVQQMQYIADREDALRERDVIVLTDTSPADRSEIRETLRPRGFMVVLVGKDGNRILRKPFPWSVRELTRSIDKQPIRQQEVRDRRAAE